jgi:hypothetical protein
MCHIPSTIKNRLPYLISYFQCYRPYAKKINFCFTILKCDVITFILQTVVKRFIVYRWEQVIKFPLIKIFYFYLYVTKILLKSSHWLDLFNTCGQPILSKNDNMALSICYRKNIKMYFDRKWFMPLVYQ